MSAMTIRNLDERVKRAIRKQAAEHGVSMEQEVRDMLTEKALGQQERRNRLSFEELMKLSVKPVEPVDGKKARDEVWDYLYEDDRR